MTYSLARSSAVGTGQYRTHGVGVVAGGGRVDDIDTAQAGGNFTLTPPILGGPHAAPQGVMLHGSKVDPRIVALFQAQGLRTVEVDTSWLSVGHLDAVVNFAPSTTAPRGWVAVVPDPRAGEDMLRDLSARGLGSLAAPSGEQAVVQGKPLIANPTVDGLLRDPIITGHRDLVHSRADAAVEVLKTRLGLGDADIVRLPVLKRVEDFGNGRILAHSALPNVVNWQSVGGGVVLAPAQHGPIVNGVDVLQQRVEALMAPHGVRVKWVDALTHTLSGGELHFGSNVYRALDARGSRALDWWKVARR